MAKNKVIKPDDRYWKTIKLWHHQKVAVDHTLNYINSYSSTNNKSYLIKMPMGSGKTGIIAVLSRCFSFLENILIVVPSEALREQLIRQISTGFWNKINVNYLRIYSKRIFTLLPSSIVSDLNKNRSCPFIAIGTVQALQDIYRTDLSAYNDLKSQISLVIFDEGHREPALEWSKSIRELDKPMLLFSATPYRNDLKIFNVNPTNFYFLSHNEALKNKFIRKIEFHERNNLSQNINTFIDRLITFVDSKRTEFKNNGILNPKVIVRCATGNKIKEITEALRTAGKDAVGIHEDFDNSGFSYLVKNVPDSTVMNYEYYIHQFKLVEGIDNSDFCVLAIFENFSNARSLVQQIGRIIRNSDRRRIQNAFVFIDSQFKSSLEWNSYQAYDEYCKNKRKFINLIEIFDEYLESHPEFYYYNTRFRKQLDFEKNDLYRSFNYKLSSNVYVLSSQNDFNNVKDKLINEWEKNDFEIKKIENPDNDTIIITYISFNNSRLLIDELFLEFRLCYTFAKVINNILFFYDSEGNTSLYITNNFSRVSQSKLINLFENADKYVEGQKCSPGQDQKCSPPILIS